jgi:hypothetical protein
LYYLVVGVPLLVFDARIIKALPTADGKSLCLVLQFIRLEGNPEGRQGLQKLCNFGGIYYEPTGNEIV